MHEYSPSIEELESRIQSLIDAREGDLIRPRIIITISGIPGSGKSTLANLLAERLNASKESKHHKTVSVPMDGYHLPRSDLDAEGLRRRGSPHTFDAASLLRLVNELKTSTFRNLPSRNGSIFAPSFDHALKDPVQDDIEISRSINIVILEGNYLLLKDDVWCKVHQLVTESWFLECPFDVAKERLAKRHVAAGITETLEAGIERVEFNDEPNGRYLVAQSQTPSLTITQV